jgi:hypothetical protein
MKLSLAAKFNAIFLFMFAVCFLATGFIAVRQLQSEARKEVLQNARLLMEPGSSVRSRPLW